MGEILQPELRRIGQQVPRHVGAVHGKGLVASLHMVKPGGIEPNAPLAADIVRRCVEKGLLMFAPGRLRRRQSVKIAPPLDHRRGAAARRHRRSWKKPFEEAIAMNAPETQLEVLIVGGGMITHDQILPSLYHLQRRGAIGADRDLPPSTRRRSAAWPKTSASTRPFPARSFDALPTLDRAAGADVSRPLPRGDRGAAAATTSWSWPCPITSTTRSSARPSSTTSTSCPSSRSCCKYAQAVEIEQLARDRGLFVGVEYHKRFDRRALEARGQYRRGRFGEFRCGEAKLVEPYYYRHSNFQNWFTRENSDPFTYIGCHYVDLVYFITGLRPVEVSVRGVEGKFPNGNVGYLWSIGQVVWENGAVLSVLNGLGYPDEGAGTNDQGLCLFCEGPDCGGIVRHDDQFRGVSHGYVDTQSGADVPLRQPRLLPPRPLGRRGPAAGRLRLRLDRGPRPGRAAASTPPAEV